MREHAFHRRGGFDAGRLAIRGSEDGHVRSFARRHWGWHLPLSSDMALAARGLQDLVMQRGEGWDEVLYNNVANVRPDADSALRAHRFLAHTHPLLAAFGVVDTTLPDPLWLVCNEVEFHLDEDLAEEAAFIVWHVGGPAKAVDFPNMGFGLVMQPGDALLFDGMQPHGMRHAHNAGQAFEKSGVVERPPQCADDLTVFYSVDVPLTPALEQRLGIVRSTRRRRQGVRYQVDGCTGHTKLGRW